MMMMITDDEGQLDAADVGDADVSNEK